MSGKKDSKQLERTDKEVFQDLLLSTKRKGIQDLLKWLDGSDFYVAPASTKYHSNYAGGLLTHSLLVYNELMTTYNEHIKHFNIPEDSLIITALLHDICKVNYYKEDVRNVKRNGAWVQEPYYTVEDMLPLGHGEKSVILALQFIQLTDVEMAMIRNHMGAFRDTPDQVSQLFSKYPESLLLHFADMASTYIHESTEEV